MKFFQLLYTRAIDADLFSRASQVAFYFTFAIFPLLYFLVSLFGLMLVSSEGLKSELYDFLHQLMPRAVYDLMQKTIEEIILNSTGSKATIGLAVTVWSASAGVDAIRNALNAVYGLKETRIWFKIKAQSLFLTSCVASLTAVVLSIVFYGWELVQYVVKALGFEITSPWILLSIKWISILLVMLFACEIIFNLLPDFKKFKWEWVTPGSIVAIVLWIILTSGFRLYLSYFNSYDRAYGSLGAMIILMLWLYLTALVLMIGGAINAVTREIRDDFEHNETTD